MRTPKSLLVTIKPSVSPRDLYYGECVGVVVIQWEEGDYSDLTMHGQTVPAVLKYLQEGVKRLWQIEI